MKTHPDSAARFWASFALTLCIASLVILAACGCRDFEGYVAVSMLAIMAAFVGITQEA